MPEIQIINITRNLDAHIKNTMMDIIIDVHTMQMYIII